MEARKQQKYYNNVYYTEGNIARKLQVVPNYEPEQEQQIRREKVRQVRRKSRVDSGIDMFSMLVLTFAVAVTFYICIEYLGVQSNITRMNTQIADLESDLSKLQNENRAALSRLNTSVDLEHIYEVATNELGMVYPSDNQVITYESTLSDYVKQYKDIPEENNKSVLEGILK